MLSFQARGPNQAFCSVVSGGISLTNKIRIGLSLPPIRCQQAILFALIKFPPQDFGRIDKLQSVTIGEGLNTSQPRAFCTSLVTIGEIVEELEMIRLFDIFECTKVRLQFLIHFNRVHVERTKVMSVGAETLSRDATVACTVEASGELTMCHDGDARLNKNAQEAEEVE